MALISVQNVLRESGGMAAEGFFRGLSRLGRLHPEARREVDNLDKLYNVPYLDSGMDAHLLDVYRPADRTGPLPVVLYVHGGGFRILSKDTHWVMAMAFARRGYVVFNINYRLAPKHPYPAAIEDTCTAYRWVLENAEHYGGDPQKVIVAGESAGANLITSLTMAACYKRPELWARAVFDTGKVPDAAVPKCGVFQVSDIERLKRRYPSLSQFTADRLHEVGHAYLDHAVHHVQGGIDLADPVVLLERGDAPDRPLPPFLITVGTRDPLIHDSRRLHNALLALGGQSTAVFYPGELHAFQALVWRSSARHHWRQVYRFLERV